MALTALVTGLRVSEVLGLQARDLNIPARTVAVACQFHRGDVDQSKARASRRTRVIGPLIHKLAAQAAGKPPDAFLFAGKDGVPHDDRELQAEAWRPAAEAAASNFPAPGRTRFRRLKVTWRQKVGATPLEAMQGTGHSNLNMTFLYIISSQERRHVQAICDRLRGTPPEA